MTFSLLSHEAFKQRLIALVQSPDSGLDAQSGECPANDLVYRVYVIKRNSVNGH